LIDERSCISFAVRPFKWSNLAAKNAGVTVVVGAISAPKEVRGLLYLDADQVKRVSSISPYLTEGAPLFVDAASSPLSDIPRMVTGSMPRDGGGLVLSSDQAAEIASNSSVANLVRPYIGSDE